MTKSKEDKKNEKAERLAQALRANLKRRKTQAKKVNSDVKEK